MEKINSEELKKMLGRIPLSDDELEQVSGGIACYDKCNLIYQGSDSLEHCYKACDGI